MPLPRTVRSIAALLSSCCLALASSCLLLAGACAQPSPNEQLLAFTQAWRQPVDYVWRRTSQTTPRKDSGNSLTIQDEGRLRVEFAFIQQESAGLDGFLVKLRYGTFYQGEPVESGIGMVEQKRMPRIWLHPVAGYSQDAESGDVGRYVTNSQALSVYEVVDFRGFVPDQIPEPGMTWNARMLRRPDDVFRFTEETVRSFVCRQVKPGPHGSDPWFGVDFTEEVKITPTDAFRTWELRQRQGHYWVQLPAGLVEAASWEEMSEEKIMSGSDQTTLKTLSSVILMRVPGTGLESARPTPPPGRSEPPFEFEIDIPLPPRWSE